MKIIFLDYDGVICHVMVRLIENKLSGDFSNRGHDPRVIGLLELLQRNNPDLLYVCSSRAHRKDTKHEQEAVFKELGFNLVFHDDHKTLPAKSPLANRGLEVKNWLDAHPEVTDYLMIDDSIDYPPIPDDKFLHIPNGEMMGGLTMHYFQEIEKRLHLNLL